MKDCKTRLNYSVDLREISIVVKLFGGLGIGNYPTDLVSATSPEIIKEYYGYIS